MKGSEVMRMMKFHSPKMLIVSICILLIVPITACFDYFNWSDDASPDLSENDEDDSDQSLDNYSWTDDGGNTVELYDYMGDVVMLNVGAGWCAPCRENAPKFEENIYQSYKDQGFTLIGLIVEDDLYQSPTEEFLQSWRDQYNLNYIICADPEWSLQQLFEINSLPFTLILDREMIPRFHSYEYDEVIFADTIEDLL